MRAQRRTAFAAPFVMVVGCGSPTRVPPVEEPLRPEPEPFRFDAGATSAQVDEPRVVAHECHEQVSCNDCKVEMFKGGKAAVGRVIAKDGEAGQIKLEVEMPSKFVVHPYFTAFFVDENMEPLAAPALELSHVGTGTITVKGPLTCELPSKLVYVWDAPPTFEVPYCDRPGVHCNPPRPPKPDCCINPPPPGQDVRIIGLRVESGGTVVTLGIGSAKGVTQESRITIAHVDCTNVVVSERTTTCRVNLTPDQVKGTPTARVDPR